MKLTIVIEVVVLCMLLTMFSVFTIDSGMVRKAELLSIMSTDVDAVCQDYFSGKLNDKVSLQHELEAALISSIKSEVSDIDVSIYKADIEQGIIEIVVELTYRQPTGKSKTITMERIYRDI